MAHFNVQHAIVATGNNVRSDLVTSDIKSYTYAPTAIASEGKILMMFCGLNTELGHGDAIYRTKQTIGESQWSKPVKVFSASKKGFDRLHVCDPSIVRAHGQLFMYYSGAKTDEGHNPTKPWTSIGVARSDDNGYTWRRVVDTDGHSKAIVLPHDPNAHASFGAGQPSVFFRGGLFHMLYTDSTISAESHLVLMRSEDWKFHDKVQYMNPKTGKFESTKQPLFPGTDHDMAFLDDHIVMTVMGRIDPKRPFGHTHLITFAVDKTLSKNEFILKDRIASNNSCIVRTPTGKVFFNDKDEFTIVRTVANKHSDVPPENDQEAVKISSLESTRFRIKV